MKRLGLVSMLLFLTAVGCATPSQMAVDAEVQRLCAIDGGIKVYETVKLPPSEFDQWGMPKMYQQRVENKAAYQHDGTRTVMEFFLGPEYIYRSETQRYRKESPTLVRYHHEVAHKSDGKLLGETVSYGRGGGDLPGPWEPSNFHCPPTSESSEIALFKKIFLPLGQE